jgi:hypothetical protein
MGLVPKAIPIIRHWVKGEVSVKVGLSLCLTLDGKREDLSVDLVFYTSILIGFIFGMFLPIKNMIEDLGGNNEYPT